VRLAALLCVAACSGSGATPSADAPVPDAAAPDAPPAADAGPAFLVDPKILVQGVGVTNTDCRTAVCGHNENTDLLDFGGAIYLVHRTALSQILGPNSSLRVYRSTNGGQSFDLRAVLPAPEGRDLRDPCFYVIGDKLALKGLTRLPVVSSRDSNVDTITVGSTSDDGGMTWTPFAPLGPETWSFWRVRQFGGTYYAGAYEDGDKSLKLFSSADGLAWTAGAVIYGVAADTPLEPELVFMPSGRLLVFFRLDGTDDELLGNVGRLRTGVCWAMPPYPSFDCPQILDGVRLDGPVAFFHGGRLFVIARKHLIEAAMRKRTALYELGGTLEGGHLTVAELGVFPSAGDTAYAGVADVGDDRLLATWYSSNLLLDESWFRGILDASDIWQTTLDMSRL